MLDRPSNRVDVVRQQSFSVCRERGLEECDALIHALEAAARLPLESERDALAGPALEGKTYTCDVLPTDLRTGSKAADIARETAFCAGELAG
jgi:hypothetical protein